MLPAVIVDWRCSSRGYDVETHREAAEVVGASRPVANDVNLRKDGGDEVNNTALAVAARLVYDNEAPSHMVGQEVKAPALQEHRRGTRRRLPTRGRARMISRALLARRTAGAGGAPAVDCGSA